MLSGLRLSAIVGAAHAAYSSIKVGQDLSLTLSGQAVAPFAQVITHTNGLFVSPHFAFLDIPNGGYLTISALDGSQAVNYTGTRDDFYADFVTGPHALVTYTPPADTAGLNGQNAFYIDRFSSNLLEPNTESICGIDNSQSAVCYKDKDPVKYQKSQAIARLFIEGSSLCTGWLLGSEGHMITNNHCINSVYAAGHTQFEFGAECKQCDSNPQQEFTCPGTVVATSSELIYTNASLDVTLVKLTLKPGASLAPYGYLQARASGPVLKEEIYIAEHPRGRPSRIAAVTDDGKPGLVESMSLPRSCVKDEIGYKLDTEGGASGSPVLSASDNLVVALHNCGGCAADSPDGLNGAVKMDKIIKELQRLNVLPKDALGSGNGPSPVKPTTTAPSTSSPATTTSPTPTSTVPKTKKPVTTSTPTATPQPSGPTYAPSTIPTKTPSTTPKHTCKPFKPKRTPAPTPTTPVTTANVITSKPTTAPVKSCGSCVGCYFSAVKWCVMTDVSKSACEAADGGVWCR